MYTQVECKAGMQLHASKIVFFGTDSMIVTFDNSPEAVMNFLQTKQMQRYFHVCFCHKRACVSDNPLRCRECATICCDGKTQVDAAGAAAAVTPSSSSKDVEWQGSLMKCAKCNSLTDPDRSLRMVFAGTDVNPSTLAR